MQQPIQMELPESEHRDERKLFVGMLNKRLSENDLRQLFEKYGVIEECSVLRDRIGHSKGCGFVTFTSKQAAIAAVEKLHQSLMMESCSAPLVVKFADTAKEKERKRAQQFQEFKDLLYLSGVNSNMPISQTEMSSSTPLIGDNDITQASQQTVQQLQQQSKNRLKTST